MARKFFKILRSGHVSETFIADVRSDPAQRLKSEEAEVRTI